MKVLMKKVTVIMLALSIIMLNCIDTSAAGKTIGAYKCTTYGEKGSDAKTIYNGVKEKVFSWAGGNLEFVFFSSL